MAITGRFEADFQDFYAAVDKADAKLADFQSGAGKVETALNRMVDNFSGRRLLQEATVAAEAIERIGGVSKLTDAELQKVGATAVQAVEKLTAMGVEVPESIRRIADEATKAAYATEQLGEAARAASAQVEAETAAAAKAVEDLAAKERAAAAEAQSFVDKFNGKALIDEATKSAAAIEKIGGASKLTEDELQKVAATSAQAVEKMKALGIQVPPGIQSIANELKPVNKEMGFMGEQALELGKKFVAAFAVEKVIEFALNVGKAQQAMSRLSSETQIGTDELQDLTAATQGYGLSNEELAKALFNVSKGIAGGDESVARGLSQIGISLDQVKDKRGKELFLEIEDGLSRLQGSLRDTAAAEIFGSKLGAAMAGFSKEAREAVAQAEAFNVKLSPKEIEDLKNYADQVERLEKNFGALKDKILGGFAGAINAITDANKNGVSWWKLASDGAKDYLSQMFGLGPGVNLALTLAQSEAKIAEEQAKVAEGAQNTSTELSKEAQAIQFLTTLRSNAAKELEPYQKRGLEDLRAMGQLNAQNAAAIGVSSDQFKQYTENVRQAEVATKALTDATLQTAEQVRKIQADVTTERTKQTGTQTEIELAAINTREQAELASLNKRSEALKANLAAQHADTKENLDKIDADNAAATAKIQQAYDQLRDGVGVDWDEIKSHTQAALDDAADRALKTLIEARGTIGITREELIRLEENYRRAAFAATAAGQAGVQAAQAGTSETEKWNASVKKASEEWDALRKKQEAVVTTTEITAANIDQYNPAGVSKSELINLLKQGFSLQNALEVIAAAKRGVQLDLSKWPEDQRGPRVPGFKYGVDNFRGGTAIVGEDGPEVVNLPKGASVIPLRGGGRGGGFPGSQIYAPVYVSGVFDPSSAYALKRTVNEAQFRSVQNARVIR